MVSATVRSVSFRDCFITTESGAMLSRIVCKIVDKR